MLNPGPRVTVLIPSGPENDPDRPHLFVLLTGPHGPAREVLMVPICSRNTGRAYDDGCLLAAGEHPAVTHDSYVGYHWCRIVAADVLVKLEGDGDITVKEPASGALVKKIVAGLSKSKFVAPRARNFYREYEKTKAKAP